jgi:uncharacterized protein YhaN
MLGKMSRMEHPLSKECLEEFNKYGIGRQFLSYVKSEQVLAWFITIRKKQHGYEEVMRKAMATTPVERPEDLVESIVKQCQDFYAKTRKINTLEQQVAKLQEEVKKLEEVQDGLQKEQERQTNRIKKLKNTTALQKAMKRDLNAASKVAQDIVDMDQARYMANKVIQNWVGPRKKAVDFAKALGRYTDDLNNAMEDLGQQIMLTRKYLEVQAGLSHNGSEGDKAGPS